MPSVIIGDIFRFDVSPGWEEITSHLPEGAPFTLAKPEGVGVFQFSMAQYTGGTRPQTTVEDLERLRDQFASQNDFTDPFDAARREQPPMMAVASYGAPAGEFCRVWYLSDGANFVLATYTCAWRDRASGEVGECDDMLSRAEFDPPPPAADSDPNQQDT